MHFSNKGIFMGRLLGISYIALTYEFFNKSWRWILDYVNNLVLLGVYKISFVFQEYYRLTFFVHLTKLDSLLKQKRKIEGKKKQQSNNSFLPKKNSNFFFF